MTKKNKSNKVEKIKISKLLTSDWFITLSATLIGVFVAIFANTWIESNKIQQKKQVAIENILSELSVNSEIIQNTIEIHIQIYEALSFMYQYMNDEHKLIASSNEMNEFQTNSPGIITITDSLLLKDGRYKYSGKVNIDLSLPQFEISNISWLTAKNSGLVVNFDYKFLKYLQTVYKLQDDILQRNKKLVELFIEKSATGSGYLDETLINNLEYLINTENNLLEMYEIREK